MTFPERFTEVVVDFPRRILLSDGNGAYSSEQVFLTAKGVAQELLSKRKFAGERIALLAPPGLSYVAGMLAGWMRGAMVVPLCPEHPPAEMAHVLSDSQPAIILCHPSLRWLLPETKIQIAKLAADKPQEDFIDFEWNYPSPNDAALMLYTSGTTGKPKGVVHTHASLAASVECLIEAWEWTENDRILHFLPLHHTHGIVNKLLCPLWAGARCDMLPKFDSKVVWEKLVKEEYTVLMAVPTVYAKLIQAWEEADETTKQNYAAACKKLRLMVSGSAALPVSVLEKWKMISGHVLLERYGMTEIGMALSNPLHGERRAGFVGQPLPGMEVRMNAEQELEVRGRNVFKEYWKRADETKKSFTSDGWFRTGDMVAFEDGYYRIVGRLSTDIIKCGGYKISALEIESILLQHTVVREACVVGIADETWGEKIAAILVLKEGQTLTLDELRDWAKPHLANYKLPTLLKIVEVLPRNAMGKTVKNEAKKLLA